MKEVRKQIFDLVVVGGGAAGFFGAISCSESSAKPQKILILEATKNLMRKVRISGGGRCNFTHDCFDPKELVENYPRGRKELLGPFFRFGPKDMIAWFADHGVDHHTESDGRIFPVTNSSGTIIECFLTAAKSFGIEHQLQSSVEKVEVQNNTLKIETNQEIIWSKNILLATGSSPQGHKIAQSLGHSIYGLAPSIFTFRSKSTLIDGLEGLSMNVKSSLSIGGQTIEFTGPLLITHWGVSGPVILKTSAFAARILKECGYKAEVVINWQPRYSSEQLRQEILGQAEEAGQRALGNVKCFDFPSRLWKAIVREAGLEKLSCHRLSEQSLASLVEQIQKTRLQVHGRGIFKDEFVTAGGVLAREVDFRTMESKRCPGVYFAGEILDIDGVTGGFNFQNAWTTARIAGEAIARGEKRT